MITTINLAKRIAVLTDGTIVPVTNMIDVSGDDTDEILEANSFVCGPMPDGTWVADWVENFDRQPTQ